MVAVSCLWFGVSSGAKAQTLRRVEDGEGLKVGARSRFHTGFALATGFDSNVFYENRRETPRRSMFATPVAWAGIGNRRILFGALDVPPWPTASKFDYNIAALAGYRQYLTGRDEVLRQSRFSVGVEAHLNAWPGRRFSIILDEVFYRIAEPRNIEAGPSFNSNRIDHRGYLGFIGRPGGGRVSLEAGYQSQVLYFENGDRDASRGDRMIHGAAQETKWRFLPRSAVLLRYAFAWTYYLSCCQTAAEGRNEDNFAHRVLGGFQGQLSKKLVGTALAGWGWGKYRNDPQRTDFSGFLGQLGLDYYPTPRGRFGVSLDRRFQDSLFGNYYVDLGGRILARQEFSTRTIAEASMAVMGRRYAGLPTPGSEYADISRYGGLVDGTRKDVLFLASVKVEQPIRRIFSVALSYDVVVDRTSFMTFFTNGFADRAGFSRHLVMLLLAVRL